MPEISCRSLDPDAPEELDFDEANPNRNDPYKRRSYLSVNDVKGWVVLRNNPALSRSKNSYVVATVLKGESKEDAETRLSGKVVSGIFPYLDDARELQEKLSFMEKIHDE